MNFKLFGIPIQVQAFFWFVMAYLGGGIKLLSAPTSTALVSTAVFVGAGFLSILVHELGHALMMKKFGRHPHIVLHGMGGYAMSSGVSFSRWQNILVTLMGPMAQFGLAGVALFILNQVSSFPTPQSEAFVRNIYTVSIWWATINLVPIFPLDGGQLMLAIFGERRKKVVHFISIFIGVALIILMLMNGLGMMGMLILGMLVFENIKAIQKM